MLQTPQAPAAGRVAPPGSSRQITEVLEEVFAIEIPMPNSPLKSMDAYLLRGERSLLIDTGLNLPGVRERLLGGLETLGVSLDQTDIAVTHLHSDHTGLLPSLITPSNRAYMSYADGRFVNEMVYIDYGRKVAYESALFGVPPERVLKPAGDATANHVPERYVDFQRVNPGDVLHAGDYSLEIIDLAGHTPGHIGFYDARHKAMFCGDHVMNGISPNIVDWNDGVDSLALFCRNLAALKEREIDYLLPAHRGRVIDWRGRVDQLVQHHRDRCREILAALAGESLTVFEVSARITWSYMEGRFTSFPPLQTWFSTSEAFAHLEHLRREGWVDRREHDGSWLYCTNPGSPKAPILEGEE